MSSGFLLFCHKDSSIYTSETIFTAMFASCCVWLCYWNIASDIRNFATHLNLHKVMAIMFFQCHFHHHVIVVNQNKRDRGHLPGKTWYRTYTILDHVTTMRTSSNGNIFRVTVPFSGEFTGQFPSQRQWRGALVFLFSLICAWINGWVKNREAGDLGRHRAHYIVTVMPRP